MDFLPTATIDRFGELERQLAIIKPEHKGLREQILKHYGELAGSASATGEVNDYVVQISARENETKIVRQWKAFYLLYKTIGLKRLVALVTIPLRDGLYKYLTAEQWGPLVSKQPTGSRTVTAVPTQAASKAA